MEQNRQKINILHLRASNFYGGPERQMHFHAKQIDKNNFDITISSFTENNTEPQFLKTISDDNIPTHVFDVKNAYDTKAVKLLRTYLLNNNIDIFCTHDYRTHFYASLARKQTNVKWLAFSRGWTQENLKIRFFCYMDKFIIRKADHIIAVSQSQKEKLVEQSIKPERITTVHNAIDLSFIEAINAKSLKERFSFPQDSFVVVSGGRFSKEKGQMYLIKAAELAIEQNNKLRFVLFGEGPDLSKAIEYNKNKNLSDYILCPGFESGLLSYLKSADLLINPSLSEGLPNIVLEALASNIPVILTKVGGHPEIVTDNVNGYLIEPKYISQMSKKILSLANDESKRQYFIGEGKKVLLDKFSFEAQNRKLTQIYNSILK